VARDDDDEGPWVPPYEGKFAEVMKLLASKRAKEALALASQWHEADLGDVLALVGMGEAYEALGNKDEAARCYGSIIDLFPSRADLRRFAGNRLERLGIRSESVLGLAIDTYKKAVASRPDHPSSHRLYAYALARAGYFEKAFDAILAGFQRGYPSGRFAGARHVLFDDVGILAAAWIRAEPGKREEISRRAQNAGVPVATQRSLRFVLTWETDANDVDFHINDGRGAHAFYQAMELPSGGALYADVTTGYGPECFAIPGAKAYPYRLRAHYYAKGPMGYGMGTLQILEHDGKGGLRFEDRPFVVMTDRAFVDLGVVSGPLKEK
jgi:tetratricopeptide (TPR) repeat protein